MSTLQNLPPGPSKYWSNAVANAALLPASGAAIGECRLTIDTKRIYEWNGTAWVVIGSGSGGDVLAANVAAITSNAVVFAASASLSGATERADRAGTAILHQSASGERGDL